MEAQNIICITSLFSLETLIFSGFSKAAHLPGYENLNQGELSRYSTRLVVIEFGFFSSEKISVSVRAKQTNHITIAVMKS